MTLDKFKPAIQSMDLANIVHAGDIPDSLMFYSEGDLTSYYIPFEYVNPHAKVVLVGITPGLVQWRNAMSQAKQAFRQHLANEEVLRQCKQTGAFSGPMRTNLIEMLDAVGLHKWLHLKSCSELFSSASHLVQTTSLLRNPVFYRGENYNGTPDMIRSSMLKKQLLDGFARECQTLKSAVFIPLGPKVASVLDWLGAQRYLEAGRVLDGMPHPSGANAERIAYFLGRKEKEKLSSKTNGDQLDAARQRLLTKVANLSTVPHMTI
ncbi:hypothetical protein [Crenobacter intestini]|uniref:Uracil-DNA glycosylase-like domain-containing protein n=1 Tax=Crenobacter intestini TaxID=2563443 RepID=A0A4T0UJI8_9NEIS|nr:hypothetical protein [Crenobacter intestini]TIC78481.1 hypothetical protein E5K04_16010 [Crenobacter intestini]